MNYIYFYPEFERILVCILIIAGICMQCFAFIYKFNSGAKGFKYVCELSFEFSVILLQFIYGYIYIPAFITKLIYQFIIPNNI